MPQRTDQAQAFCNRCQKSTLHQRNVTETNHVLHLLLTLFCCSMWLPIWLLIAIVNSLENPPYLCTQCGQTVGRLTPEQLCAMAQQAAIEHQRIADATAKARAEGREHRAELYSQVGTGMKTGVAATIEELKRLPGRTDRVLRIVAGEGNDIIFWFLRIATVTLTVGLAIGMLAGIVSAIASLI